MPTTKPRSDQLAADQSTINATGKVKTVNQSTAPHYITSPSQNPNELLDAVDETLVFTGSKAQEHQKRLATEPCRENGQLAIDKDKTNLEDIIK